MFTTHDYFRQLSNDLLTEQQSPSTQHFNLEVAYNFSVAKKVTLSVIDVD